MTNKTIGSWIRLAKGQAWAVEYTGGGHYRWTPPDGPSVVTSSTPGGSRAIANIRAKLRKAGLRIP